MKTLCLLFACFFMLLLGGQLPGTAQSPAPLKISPVLGKSLEEVEKLLGTPRHVGKEWERYYKVPGFVRIVVRPTPQKMLATITFQFEPGKIKSEREALTKARVQEIAVFTSSVATTQNVTLTNHFRERMQEREVSEAQAQDVLQNGKRFYYPKNDSYIRWKDGIYIAHTKDGCNPDV